MFKKAEIFFVLLVSIIEAKRVLINFSDKEVFNFNKLTKINDIYKDCGSETGTINKVTITDCNQAPCVFNKGKNYTLELEFVSKVDTKSVVNKVFGIIAKVPVPFPLPNDNGCTLGIDCPVKSGDSLKESVLLHYQSYKNIPRLVCM
ncbi:unnamed protein product [Brachionus calyciflorus]|uniref:MD-2-related lipid-recognition domain-containing protein n=1 Tax=Brachionus calyciflorus TaxID=104777 RepID=A0A814SAT3_9BILA|nr:unnamed protein product [Brachionus calyciflorus]